MKGRKPADLCRHLSLAMVGGFFGAYAIMSHGSLANAQTANLLELLLSLLQGRWSSIPVYLGCFFLYVAGIMLPVLLQHYLHVHIAYLSLLISALTAVILPFIPAETPSPLCFYPIFFTVSFQWTTFSGARGYVSSTIFSTNNTKQASLGLAEFLCDGDHTHLYKAAFYGATILFFHLGAAASFFAVQYLGRWGSLLCLILIANALVMVLWEERTTAKAAV